MSVIDSLTQQLEGIAQLVPVEVFVFIGALIEELIAPIPSPIVMTLSGSIAEAQGQTVVFLFLLALIGAIGKSIGSFFLYVLSDKLEDVVIGKFGKFFGISHKEIESIGRHFKGNFRDEIVIFLARAIPIIPTAPVSIVCGAIKIPLRSYLVAGFFGLLIRNLFYLYVGFAGLASYQSLMGHLDSIESIMTVTIGIILIGTFGLIWYSKNKDKLVDFISESAAKKSEPKSKK